MDCSLLLLVCPPHWVSDVSTAAADLTKVRKFFIIHVARELKLIFPTATATAMTISSMHSISGNGGENSKKKTRALAISFAVSISFRVLASYFPGILFDWHIFSWFHVWSGYKSAALAVENWGWFLEFTPAFIGSGMLVGLNPAISFFLGSILAWGESLAPSNPIQYIQALRFHFLLTLERYHWACSRPHRFGYRCCLVRRWLTRV